MILPICFGWTGFLYLHDDFLVVVLEFGELEIVFFHAEVLVVFQQGVPGVLIAANGVSVFFEFEVGLAE